MVDFETTFAYKMNVILRMGGINFAVIANITVNFSTLFTLFQKTVDGCYSHVLVFCLNKLLKFFNTKKTTTFS